MRAVTLRLPPGLYFRAYRGFITRTCVLILHMRKRQEIKEQRRTFNEGLFERGIPCIETTLKGHSSSAGRTCRPSIPLSSALNVLLFW